MTVLKILIIIKWSNCKYLSLLVPCTLCHLKICFNDSFHFLSWKRSSVHYIMSYSQRLMLKLTQHVKSLKCEYSNSINQYQHHFVDWTGCYVKISWQTVTSLHHNNESIVHLEEWQRWLRRLLYSIINILPWILSFAVVTWKTKKNITAVELSK